VAKFEILHPPKFCEAKLGRAGNDQNFICLKYPPPPTPPPPGGRGRI